jgi:hypothetical protein
LEKQTLDKLSTAPWRFLHPGTNMSELPAAHAQRLSNLLHPLLDDLVQEESYLEMREGTNGFGELVLAVHLDEQRAGLWKTNLAAVMESLTGIRPQNAKLNSGWSLKKHHAPDLIEYVRVGEWALMGTAQEYNALFSEVLARLQKEHVPFAASSTHIWLETDFDLKQLANAYSLGWKLPDNWPQISIAMSGDGKNVQTRGEMNFAKSLSLQLEPWNIPTNLVGNILSSFSAVRGVKPWLSSLPFWNNLQIGAPPNQVYSWSIPGLQMLTYFAAPVSDASNQVDQISRFVLEKVNPWFATNGSGMGNMAEFAPALHYHGLEWKGLPFVAPFLKSAGQFGNEFIFWGLFAPTPPRPMPSELMREFSMRTNLIYYGWEMTNIRTEAWLSMSQFGRLITGKSQLGPELAALKWLQSTGPKLEGGVTEIVQTAPNHLSLARKSTIGFTAMELHALADWLESPQFPQGTYSLLKPVPKKTLPLKKSPAPSAP